MFICQEYIVLRPCLPLLLLSEMIDNEGAIRMKLALNAFERWGLYFGLSISSCLWSLSEAMGLYLQQQNQSWIE